LYELLEPVQSRPGPLVVAPPGPYEELGLLRKPFGASFAAKIDHDETLQEGKYFKGESSGMSAGVRSHRRLAIFCRTYDFTKMNGRQ